MTWCDGINQMRVINLRVGSIEGYQEGRNNILTEKGSEVHCGPGKALVDAMKALQLEWPSPQVLGADGAQWDLGLGASPTPQEACQETMGEEPKGGGSRGPPGPLAAA